MADICMTWVVRIELSFCWLRLSLAKHGRTWSAEFQHRWPTSACHPIQGSVILYTATACFAVLHQLASWPLHCILHCVRWDPVSAAAYLSWQLTSVWTQVTFVSTTSFTALPPTPANNLILVLLICVFSNVVQWLLLILSCFWSRLVRKYIHGLILTQKLILAGGGTQELTWLGCCLV